MTTLYKTTVVAQGGRGGTVSSTDGLLQLKLAPPAALGGRGDATNPEQLFAAGYAACFASAIAHVARTQGRALDDRAIEVKAEVSLLAQHSGAFGLEVRMAVNIAGVGQSAADELTGAADAACPYSNAIRGNVEVAFSVTSVAISKG